MDHTETRTGNPQSTTAGRITLALETSGLQGTIALSRAGAVLVERPLQLGKRHAQTLIPDIYQAFQEAGLKPRDCELIGVSLGPGSFTGLRIGIVCAKTFAYAAGCQIVGIETLGCIAANAPADVQNVQVVVDAQRQELFVREFARTASDRAWRAVSSLGIVPIDNWLAGLTADSVVIGPGLERVAQVSSLPNNCRVLEPRTWNPTAGHIAALADRAAEAGEFSNMWSLEPIYFRKSAAEEKWDSVHVERHPI